MRFDHNNVAPLRLAVLALLDKSDQLFGYDQQWQWSVQGMGLLRLYIRKIGRLHIWDDELRYPNASMIHTHSWDLTSTIVCGSVTNVRYTEEVSGFPFKKQRLVCGFNTQVVSPVVDVNLLPWPLEALVPGDVYHQRAAEIHKTMARNGTVTIMERAADENGEADVYWPADCSWGTAKPRPATHYEVHRTVSKAIALLETNR